MLLIFILKWSISIDLNLISIFLVDWRFAWIDEESAHEECVSCIWQFDGGWCVGRWTIARQEEDQASEETSNLKQVSFLQCIVMFINHQYHNYDSLIFQGIFLWLYCLVFARYWRIFTNWPRNTSLMIPWSSILLLSVFPSTSSMESTLFNLAQLT